MKRKLLAAAKDLLIYATFPIWMPIAIILMIVIGGLIWACEWWSEL